MAEAQPGERSQAVARYKQLLRDYIDRRPSGLRGKLALALGKHKSFISQITNPAYAVPIPAGDLATIFALCHLAPEERLAFMRLYRAAHPERARRLRPVSAAHEVRIQLPSFRNEVLARELEALILDFAARSIRLAQRADGRETEEPGAPPAAPRRRQP
jgi:hypothetical protein